MSALGQTRTTRPTGLRLRARRCRQPAHGVHAATRPAMGESDRPPNTAQLGAPDPGTGGRRLSRHEKRPGDGQPDIHSMASLHETFEPAEAWRMAERLDNATPTHGTWLNLAESELSVLNRQCLSRRIPDRATPCRGVGAWEERRYQQAVTATWRFKTADAGINLKPLDHAADERNFNWAIRDRIGRRRTVRSDFTRPPCLHREGLREEMAVYPVTRGRHVVRQQLVGRT